MHSNATRIAALLVTLAVIVGLFFAFRGPGDDGDATTATTEAATATTTAAPQAGKADGVTGSPSPVTAIPRIDVVDGEPKGGVAELEFDKGDEIAFEVTSDAADEVHVHGYDVEAEVPAGGTAKLDFRADLDGVFEVELHHSGTEIAVLTVNP
ncbi:MAG: hypothetical protein R2691_05995 [Solirubrobacterales bacterium]